MNWNSVPGFHLSVAAALSVGGLILVLREFKIGKGSSFAWFSGRGDGGEGSERMCLVPGLQNLGNNCFLNVILQALSSCSTFQEYLITILEEYESLPDGQVKSMLPLTNEVTDLIEELNAIRDRKVVLSPRQVMYAVQSYNNNFSLAEQQDAAEAFLHLLCSLREEVSASYVPNNGSLIDVSAGPRRILDLRRFVEDHNEHKRWKELYLGPFDGILGNILTCRSCSFQIMMDFEFFHILPLLPVTGMGTSIFYGCSLEHCLKQYIASDEVEGYKCHNCWHITALKYYLSTNGKETDIETLKSCSGQEECECRSLPGLDAIPVRVSRAFKQLNIARSPEVLCIQLLRATTNLFGDLIKLEGHISFPLILDLSPFVKIGFEMEQKATASRWHADEHDRQGHPVHYLNRQVNAGALSHVYFQHQEKQRSEITLDKLLASIGDSGIEDVKSLPQIKNISQSRPEVDRDNERKVCTGISNLEPHAPRSRMYRLVSVIEHMGKSGGGHYTVYRRLKSYPGDESDSANMASPDQWFLISDSDVVHVSEKEVLSAQATILFYERITES